MNYLEERIIKDATLIKPDILKVGNFLNQQVDINLMKMIGNDFKNHFKDYNINKIITIESSGIAPAYQTAVLLNVPLVILKKSTSKTLGDNIYKAKVKSFTKNNEYTLITGKELINENDNILIIDDFLAKGEACLGAIKIVNEACANVSGIGIIIEKTFQVGRKKLNDNGYYVYSIAQIASMDNDMIKFVDEDVMSKKKVLT